MADVSPDRVRVLWEMCVAAVLDALRNDPKQLLERVMDATMDDDETGVVMAKLDEIIELVKASKGSH